MAMISEILFREILMKNGQLLFRRGRLHNLSTYFVRGICIQSVYPIAEDMLYTATPSQGLT